MLRRNQLYILALSLVLLSLISCAQEGKHAHRRALRLKHISVALAAEPSSLDCRSIRSLEDQSIAKLLYEGLLVTGPDGSCAPGIAESYDISNDGLTWTFHLRPSQWSNGDPVSATDFELSWKQQLDPEFPAPLAELLYVLENAKGAKNGEISIEEVGVKALDDLTLLVKLHGVTPYFEDLLTEPSFSAVNQRILAKHPTAYESNPIGNGPFVLNRYRANYELAFGKNSRYWNAAELPFNEKLLRFLIVDDPTALQMFEIGELSWAGSPLGIIPNDAIPTLQEQGLLQETQVAATEFIRLNTSDETLACPALRRSLQKAVDHPSLVQNVALGSQIAAYSLVPPCVPPYVSHPQLEALSAEEELSQALTQLGLSSASDLPPITLTYTPCPRRHAIAQTLQAQWQETLGIDITLERLEKKTVFRKRKSGNYQLLMGNWFADYNDANNFLQLFSERDASGNETGWENAVYSLLMHRASSEQNAERRRRDFEEAERILAHEAPIIPLYHFVLNHVQDPALQGVVVTPTGRMEFRHAFVADPLPSAPSPSPSLASSMQDKELRR